MDRFYYSIQKYQHYNLLSIKINLNNMKLLLLLIVF